MKKRISEIEYYDKDHKLVIETLIYYEDYFDRNAIFHNINFYNCLSKNIKILKYLENEYNILNEYRDYLGRRIVLIEKEVNGKELELIESKFVMNKILDEI